MKDKNFTPDELSPEIEKASDALFPRVTGSKAMAHMTNSELFDFMKAVLGYPSKVGQDLEEIDETEHKSFMEAACDSWEELGNNGEPLQPEDLDVDSVHNE